MGAAHQKSLNVLALGVALHCVAVTCYFGMVSIRSWALKRYLNSTVFWNT